MNQRGSIDHGLIAQQTIAQSDPGKMDSLALPGLGLQIAAESGELHSSKCHTWSLLFNDNNSAGYAGHA